ncbi:MAG: glycosyltransferase [Chitinophagales bacterium]
MILTILTLLILIGLLSYYIIFSRIKISSFKNSETQFNKAISVVICAKNEAENIEKNAIYWLTQEYTDYEVVLVNDQSTDNSAQVLEVLQEAYNNLKVINIPHKTKKNLKGKRHALWEGIKAAKNEYLLFTDADTVPHSRLWIKEMTKAFKDKNIEIILGFSPYLTEHKFVNRLIQFDTFVTALQYFGFAEIGLAYMSVGRNVAYKKSIFSEKIFLKSNKSISGDDDLVFQVLAEKNNVAYQLSKQSFAYSKPEKNLKNWIKQKSRHTSAGKFYPIKIKILLGVFIILNIFFTGLFFFNLINNFALFLAMILFKILVFNTLLQKNRLSESKNIVNNSILLFIELVYWIFYIIFVLKPPNRVINDPKSKKN